MRASAFLIVILMIYLPVAFFLNQRPGTDANILSGPFIQYEHTHGFIVHPAIPGAKPDDKDNLDQSTLQLYEDGKPLGPAHSVHRDVMVIGQGRYSHWRYSGTMLLFSTSDNTDPNTNGRTYSVFDPRAPDPYRAQRRAHQAGAAQAFSDERVK
ncbi:hypothetical protein C2U70_12850 [Bradyrhizobium guangdongense]|uniref:hypothetical protein n=1 Tax=Bradyrhizobium guangdongense TaxID=1325090 RepID=UPI0011292D36|nr:hypothetical protein [Bradyrhizobium guangdongense]TPQ36238.1 hypothetical protein C2U70_12850 [Bradyrhizobium guangdongense]